MTDEYQKGALETLEQYQELLLKLLDDPPVGEPRAYWRSAVIVNRIAELMQKERSG